jgi:glycosyltransferase involved in cell wall biosynthesis
MNTEIVVKNYVIKADSVAYIVRGANVSNVPPLISVILPVYGISEGVLKRCLDSILSNKTMLPIEIIAVDDGNDDDGVTLKTLVEYADANDNFFVINQANSFAGVARNAGIAIAKGKWIHFFDPDDWVGKSVYSDICSLISKFPDADIIKFNTPNFRHEVQESACNRYLTSEDDKLSAVSGMLVTPWSGVVKKEFIDNSGIRFSDTRRSNDSRFFWDCFVHANKVCVSSECIDYWYRPGASSSAYTQSKYLDDIFQYYWETMMSVAEYSPRLWVPIKKCAIHYVVWIVDHLLHNRNVSESIKRSAHVRLSRFLYQIVGWQDGLHRSTVSYWSGFLGYEEKWSSMLCDDVRMRLSIGSMLGRLYRNIGRKLNVLGIGSGSALPFRCMLDSNMVDRMVCVYPDGSTPADESAINDVPILDRHNVLTVSGIDMPLPEDFKPDLIFFDDRKAKYDKNSVITWLKTIFTDKYAIGWNRNWELSVIFGEPDEMFCYGHKLKNNYSFQSRNYMGIKCSLDDLMSKSFVICMNDDEYRTCCQRFKQAGFEIVPRKANACRMSKKHLGGTIAHWSIVQMAACLDWPYVVVFESDATPRKNCAKMLSDLFENGLPESATHIVLGNMMYIDTPGEEISISDLYGGRYGKIVKDLWGAQAVIYLKKGYESVLKSLPACNSDHYLQVSDMAFATTTNYFLKCNKPGHLQYDDFMRDKENVINFVGFD